MLRTSSDIYVQRFKGIRRIFRIVWYRRNGVTLQIATHPSFVLLFNYKKLAMLKFGCLSYASTNESGKSAESL